MRCAVAVGHKQGYSGAVILFQRWFFVDDLYIDHTALLGDGFMLFVHNCAIELGVALIAESGLLECFNIFALLDRAPKCFKGRFRGVAHTARGEQKAKSNAKCCKNSFHTNKDSKIL